MHFTISPQMQIRNFSSSDPEKEDNIDKEKPIEVPHLEKGESIFDFLKRRREHERMSRQKEAKRMTRLSMKMKSLNRDLKELPADFKNMEFKILFWKFKTFMKRSYKKFKVFMRHIWIELKKIGNGFRTLKQDLSFSIKTTKDTAFKEYGNNSYETKVKIRQTWADLFKFVPFSIFILIPGLELLLPAWLVIFPNAIPSQFQSESGKKKKLEELVEKQKISSEKFLKIYPKRISELLIEKEVDDEDKSKILELKKKLKDPNILTTDLLEYRLLFDKYLNFNYAPPKMLMTVCNIMSLQPVTGLNTLNNFLKIFKIKIEINNPYVAWLTRRILLREFKLYMRKLRKDDSMIRFSEIEEMDEATLNRVCFERAIPISILNRNQKIRELKKWSTLSNLRNVPDTLLILCRIIKFANIKSSVDHYSDEYLILRRCPNEIYYYEKKKMFEETLAVDELKSLVEIIKRRRRLHKDGTEFTGDDLKNYAILLKTLRDRFNDFNIEIETTYRLGNKLIDFVSNSIIVSYHMDGKQKQLEEEAPELADRAKEILGNEFYYSFPHDKEKLKSDSKYVIKLNERKNELERQLFDEFEHTKPKEQFKVM